MNRPNENAGLAPGVVTSKQSRPKHTPPRFETQSRQQFNRVVPMRRKLRPFDGRRS